MFRKIIFGLVLLIGVTFGVMLWQNRKISDTDYLSEANDVPRLLVVIVVDQMRADYLERFEDQLTGGLKDLLNKGTVFTNAHHDHATTATSCGHATLFSGLHPSSTGIIGNMWTDSYKRRRVKSVEDKKYFQFDNALPGVSPQHLNGSNLVDWLLSHYREAKVVSISGKDRSAVLMAGKKAKQVYWFNNNGGGFTTSSYYQKRLPRWVIEFNDQRIPFQWRGQEWSLLLKDDAYQASAPDDSKGETISPGFGRTFPHKLPFDPKQFLIFFNRTPWMDEYTLTFAKKAIQEVRLGADQIPDILAISLSATDSIGHLFGPDSKEIHDQILRLDRMLKGFFQFLDQQIGMENVLVILTSDHGVMPLVETSLKQGRSAKRFQLDNQVRSFAKILEENFGKGRWILDYQDENLYFDYSTVKKYNFSTAQLAKFTAEYFRQLEEVERVYTKEQLISRDPVVDTMERRLRNGFHLERSGDVLLVFKPYYLETVYAEGTSHGSPYDYDTHVPLIFLGKGFSADRFDKEVHTVDIAPTIAAVLKTKPLNPVDGKPITNLK